MMRHTLSERRRFGSDGRAVRSVDCSFPPSPGFQPEILFTLPETQPACAADARPPGVSRWRRAEARTGPCGPRSAGGFCSASRSLFP